MRNIQGLIAVTSSITCNITEQVNHTVAFWNCCKHLCVWGLALSKLLYLEIGQWNRWDCSSSHNKTNNVQFQTLLTGPKQVRVRRKGVQKMSQQEIQVNACKYEATVSLIIIKIENPIAWPCPNQLAMVGFVVLCGAGQATQMWFCCNRKCFKVLSVIV